MESVKTATSGMTTHDAQIDPEVEVRRRIHEDLALLAEAGRISKNDLRLLSWLVDSGASSARLRAAAFGTLHHLSLAMH